MGPYIYNPHIRFVHTVNSFITWISRQITLFKIRYDITLPSKVMFTMVYPMETAQQIKCYKVIYPTPRDFEVSTSVRDIEEKLRYRARLEEKLGMLSREIEFTQREVGVTTNREYKRADFISKIEELLVGSPIIDDLATDSDLRLYVKNAVAQSLVDSHLDYSNPTLQNVLGVFVYVGKIDIHINDMDDYKSLVKQAILLIRWLGSRRYIKLIKDGKFAPYVVEFTNPELVK